MTKRDYILIAAAIYEEMKDAEPYTKVAEALTNVIENLADEMAQENPRFDRARFIKACGVK